MTDCELLEMALDVIEAAIKAGDWKVDGACDPDRVIHALRARLAQPEPESESPYLIGARLFREGKGISFIPTAVPSDADIGEALQGWDDAKTAEEIAQPEPEPVAIVQQESYGRGQVLWVKPASSFVDGTPLYTAPPQREWQGMTDEEIKQLWKDTPQLVGVYSYTDIAREVEAKLKEKNGFN